jgi:hypothetical protein
MLFFFFFFFFWVLFYRRGLRSWLRLRERISTNLGRGEGGYLSTHVSVTSFFWGGGWRGGGEGGGEGCYYLFFFFLGGFVSCMVSLGWGGGLIRAFSFFFPRWERRGGREGGMGLI